MPYSINSNELYKIWFSNNPKQALGIENELALVRLRDKHPKANISLIYSSACLTRSASSQLFLFAKKHNIRLINFDTELKEQVKNNFDNQYQAALKDPTLANADLEAATLDWTLYQIAKAEIQNSIKKQGGNLAAAADITRLLEYSIENGGIYSDFDVDLDFRSIQKDLLAQCQAPIIFPAEAETLSLNSEFFAIAKTPNNTVHKQAKSLLNKAKTAILDNYSNPLKALLSPFLAGNNSFISQDPSFGCIVQSYFSKNKLATIFQFREYVKKITLRQILSHFPSNVCTTILRQPYCESFTDEQLQISFGAHLYSMLPALRRILNLPAAQFPANFMQRGKDALDNYRHTLYIMSVIQMTGPIVLKYFLKNNGVEEPEKLTSQIQYFSVNNSAFKAGIISENTSAKVLAAIADTVINDKNPLDRVGISGHISWSPVGAQKKAERELKIVKAAQAIVPACKAYVQKKRDAKKPVDLSSSIPEQKTYRK